MSKTEKYPLADGVMHQLRRQALYAHVVDMTDDEKMKMYMKCSKKDLAEMLIEREKHDKEPTISYYATSSDGKNWYEELSK